MSTVSSPEAKAIMNAAGEEVVPNLAAQNVRPQDTSPNDAGAPKLPKDGGNAPPEDKAAQEAAKAAADAAAKEAADKAAAEAAKKEEVKEYIELEDPAGRAAINLLKEAKVSPAEANSIFEKAIAEGNIDLVDWDTLKKKVSADQFVLIKAGVEQFYNGSFTETKKTTDYAFNQYGGEENWNKVKDWAQAREKTDTTFKSQLDGIRKAIQANGFQATIAIDKLKQLYETDPRNSSLTVTQIRGDAKAVALGEPLSRGDYLAELKKLHEKGYNATAERQLHARREAGRKKGI